MRSECSPTHPLPEQSYAAWASTFRREHSYGQDYLYAGPLFTHRLSHAWIDFRGIQDAFMRGKGIDYFENSGWWVSPWHFGLNQGPIILMIENCRTGLLWRLMRDCPHIVRGLRRARFAGVWL